MAINRLLLFVSAACLFLALLIALGASLFGSTFDEWLSGGLLAYILSLLIP